MQERGGDRTVLTKTEQSQRRGIEAFESQIFGGDCTKVLPSIPSESVGLVVTDPPYLVGFQCRNGRRIPNDREHAWLRPAFAEVYRVLKPDRFCVSFYGWNRVDQFVAAWRAIGFYPVGHIVWRKGYCSNEKGFLRYFHECAFLLAKGKPRKPKMLIPDVLDWTYSGNELHPTQKPVLAILPLILAFSEVGEIVLDPFAGSGTTLVAAARLGRRWVGVELSDEYRSLAEKRLGLPTSRRSESGERLASRSRDWAKEKRR